MATNAIEDAKFMLNSSQDRKKTSLMTINHDNPSKTKIMKCAYFLASNDSNVSLVSMPSARLKNYLEL